MKHKALTFLFAIVSLLTVAGAAPLEQQRSRFLAAHQRIAQGEPIDLAALERALGDYELFPYLVYYDLRRRLGEAGEAEIAGFMQDYGHLPVSELLQHASLERAARRGDWGRFLRHYGGGGGAELDCYRLQAQQAVRGTDSAWLDEARRLWLVGYSQPSACDPVFAVLDRKAALSHDDVWNRVELAMEQGQTGLARYLRPRLDESRRQWLEHWQRVVADPKRALAAPAFPLQGAMAGKIVRHGLRRLARADAEAALERFAALRASSRLFEAAEAERLQRELVLWGAYSHHPRALEWLDALPDSAVDDQVKLWRAKLALARQDWRRLRAGIETLPSAMREEAEWRYWHAYALDATGATEQARQAFRRLANERSYYGFLAADRLGLPYNMNATEVEFSDAELEVLGSRPAFRRARELFELGLITDARREWRNAVRRLPVTDRAKAAVLAARWGWFDRAIATANSAGLDDALHLRFPTPYRERVEHYSRKHRLDPSLTYALLRKESAFRSDAVSPAGALGLMQIMPHTGREVARQLNAKLPSSSALLDPDTNLNLGSAYLRKVLDEFDGSIVHAAAAYNAGPRQVAEWRQRYVDVPPEVWVETISYRETRDYVKSVLAFHAVFEWQLDGRPRPLSELLRPVEPCTGKDRDYCSADSMM